MAAADVGGLLQDQFGGFHKVWIMKSLLVAVAIIQVMGTGAFAPGGSFITTQLPRVGFVWPSGCEAVTERVRLLDRMVYRVGFGLTPGEFYRLSQDCLHSGTPDDFKRLLLDRTPLVRVLGLICLAQSVKTAELAAVAASMRADTALVTYTNGCVLDLRTTVSDIAGRLAEGRFFLAGEGEGHR